MTPLTTFTFGFMFTLLQLFGAPNGPGDVVESTRIGPGADAQPETEIVILGGSLTAHEKLLLDTHHYQTGAGKRPGGLPVGYDNVPLKTLEQCLPERQCSGG